MKIKNHGPGSITIESRGECLKIMPGGSIDVPPEMLEVEAWVWAEKAGVKFSFSEGVLVTAGYRTARGGFEVLPK